ncbi:Vegetative incompatibility protein het-e-1 [Mycena sanguinolenta]|uniref:Vegetative incompatibility protein het-e-1 n=1 Tax=Mycena sanguinolenta TaxID=230812 RepID=A0A8H6YRL6_9AGAR|nr:Vegetative incompatibility protein het-e-1 [Mycena sanguinolenta]
MEAAASPICDFFPPKITFAMSQPKNRGENLVELSADAAVAILEAVVASSAIFPPLQSAAGGALHIAKLARNFRSDKKDWNEFGEYVDKIVASVINKFPPNNPVREDIKESVRQLSSTLSEITTEIEEIQRKSTAFRFLKFATRPDHISGMRRRLDEAIKLLELKINLTTHVDVAMIAATQEENALLARHNQAVTGKLYARCMEMIGSTITYTALPYTPNAGWDDTQTCLAGTRQAEIAKVMDWVRAKDLSGKQQIYFLADVVGSGKTALAHSVAQECSDCNLLGSAFFFDRKFGRTSPRDFVFNLARDLGSRFPEVSDHITQALRADHNLAWSRPVSRLFKELILEPVINSADVVGPVVVVIDALHEAEAQTPEVENILRTQIPDLPGQFRVFVTSRPERSILRALGPDIAPHDLAIHGSANRADMAIYATQKLKEIASEHELENWPPKQLITALLNQAEGLFIWIATICDYLFHHVYPDKILKKLLESVRESQLPPEKKMDSLYSTIMASYQWDDVYFVDGYRQVMGVMVVQRSPLTLNGLQQLHGPTPRVKPIVVQLASLITGSTRTDRPVQILHSSFREYVTARAPGDRRIATETHNIRLANICLRILTTLFAPGHGIVGCGYLNSKEDSQVPEVEVDHLTEEQWYAVEFWLHHVTQCDLRLDAAKQVKEALNMFLMSTGLQSWIEVVTSKSKYQPLTPLRKQLPDDLALYMSKFTLGVRLRRLLKRLLQDEARLGDILMIMEDLNDMGETSWDTDSDSDDESELGLAEASDSSDNPYRDNASSDWDDDEENGIDQRDEEGEE